MSRRCQEREGCRRSGRGAAPAGAPFLHEERLLSRSHATARARWTLDEEIIVATRSLVDARRLRVCTRAYVREAAHWEPRGAHTAGAFSSCVTFLSGQWPRKCRALQGSSSWFNASRTNTRMSLASEASPGNAWRVTTQDIGVATRGVGGGGCACAVQAKRWKRRRRDTQTRQRGALARWTPPPGFGERCARRHTKL
jgi:hypothetical protein